MCGKSWRRKHDTFWNNPWAGFCFIHFHDPLECEIRKTLSNYLDHPGLTVQSPGGISELPLEPSAFISAHRAPPKNLGSGLHLQLLISPKV